MTENDISILIVEDQLITRLGLRMVLERMEGMRIVGDAEDGPSAVSMSIDLNPDVVLMDIVLPGFDGLEATRRIKEAVPETRVLMLTSNERPDDVFVALGAGADGYCLKSANEALLADAIRAVALGAAWFDPGVAKCVLDLAKRSKPNSKVPEKHKFSLSPRELEVLHLVVDGLSNQEIANKLIISVDTVKTTMRHIMEKLVVSDRTQAAVKALRAGLIKDTVVTYNLDSP